jgi:hypothetical protein
MLRMPRSGRPVTLRCFPTVWIIRRTHRACYLACLRAQGKYPKTLVDIAGDRALVLDYIELNTPVIKVYALRRSTTPQ